MRTRGPSWLLKSRRIRPPTPRRPEHEPNSRGAEDSRPLHARSEEWQRGGRSYDPARNPGHVCAMRLDSLTRSIRPNCPASRGEMRRPLVGIAIRGVYLGSAITAKTHPRARIDLCPAAREPASPEEAPPPKCVPPHENISPSLHLFRWRAAAQLHRVQLRSCIFPPIPPFACGRAHPLFGFACGRAWICVRPDTFGGSFSGRLRAPTACRRARSVSRWRTYPFDLKRVMSLSSRRVTRESNLRNNHTTRPDSRTESARALLRRV